ncbi:MAG: hypothetical protein K2Z81_08680, partial [Cyanobacteria bacterium]|nr:hypothetical protein [Cyanobacteriota bacterium]
MSQRARRLWNSPFVRLRMAGNIICKWAGEQRAVKFMRLEANTTRSGDKQSVEAYEPDLIGVPRSSDKSGSRSRNDSDMHVFGESKSVTPLTVGADVVSSLAASTAGLVAFAFGTKYRAAFRLAGAIGAGALCKTGLRTGIAVGINEKRAGDAWFSDTISGGIDGAACVGGALAEGWAASRYLRYLGSARIGPSTSAAILEKAGLQVVKENACMRVVSNSLRGAAGGFGSSAICSLPNGLLHEQREAADGSLDPLSSIAFNVLLGGLCGTAISGGLTAFRNAPELAGRAVTYFSDFIKPSCATSLPVDIFHLNDFHSNLFGAHGISRLATRLDELRSASQAGGRGGLFVSVGDESSGNAVSPFSYAGLIENQAISRLKPTAVVPGNHSAEIGRGKKDIAFWLSYIKGLDLGHKLAANVDLFATGDGEA